eukprot:5652952-Prymnesium_polylepis.1
MRRCRALFRQLQQQRAAPHHAALGWLGGHMRPLLLLQAALALALNALALAPPPPGPSDAPTAPNASQAVANADRAAFDAAYGRRELGWDSAPPNATAPLAGAAVDDAFAFDGVSTAALLALLH